MKFGKMGRGVETEGPAGEEWRETENDGVLE
jgi:hypothetical protein